jgi:hypothetical protein
MKVFVPVTDEMMSSKQAIQGTLVPFQPDFLRQVPSSTIPGSKPANWISNDDYATACRRLSECRAG